MHQSGRTKTEKLLVTYLAVSLFYLAAQELLNVFVYYSDATLELETFSFYHSYLQAPGVSAILILSSYLILRRAYHPPEEHRLLHVLCWLFLCVPQFFPPLRHGLNIIYTSWSFIMATAATATLMFYDLVLLGVDEASNDEKKVMYNELKFFLDKLCQGWLTMGTVLAVCMTILWTAPRTSFDMTYQERVFWAVYMVFCFMTVSGYAIVFLAYPLYKKMRTIRKVFCWPYEP